MQKKKKNSERLKIIFTVKIYYLVEIYYYDFFS